MIPSLEIERKLNITIIMPQTCHFCKEKIMKKRGRDFDSLCFHSLDGNHDNWEPSNKVPAHHGCHASYHTTGHDGGGRPRSPVESKTQGFLRGYWRNAGKKYYVENRKLLLRKAHQKCVERQKSREVSEGGETE